MWNFSGGSLVGPTGTGKTETVKVLFFILELHLFISYILYQQVLSWHGSLSNHKIAKQHNNVCKLMFELKCTWREGILPETNLSALSGLIHTLAYITRKKSSNDFNSLSENKTRPTI